MFDFTPKAGIIYNKTGSKLEFGDAVASVEMTICIGNGMRFGFKFGNFNIYSSMFSIVRNTVSWYGVFTFMQTWAPNEENKAFGQLNGQNIEYKYVFW